MLNFGDAVTVTSLIVTSLAPAVTSPAVIGSDGSLSYQSAATFRGTISAAASSHSHAISEVSNLQTSLDAKLPSTSYTAADVLSKLVTVDGAGSNLRADSSRGITKVMSFNSGGVAAQWWHIATLPISSSGTYDSISLDLVGYAWTTLKYRARIATGKRDGLNVRFWTDGDWPNDLRIQFWTQADGSVKVYAYIAAQYEILTATVNLVNGAWGTETASTTSPSGTLSWQTSTVGNVTYSAVNGTGTNIQPAFWTGASSISEDSYFSRDSIANGTWYFGGSSRASSTVGIRLRSTGLSYTAPAVQLDGGTSGGLWDFENYFSTLRFLRGGQGGTVVAAMAATGSLTLGAGSAGSSHVNCDLNAATGYDTTYSWRSAGVIRWAETSTSNGAAWYFRHFNSSGTEIDQPIAVYGGSTGTISLGGTGFRDVLLAAFNRFGGNLDGYIPSNASYNLIGWNRTAGERRMSFISINDVSPSTGGFEWKHRHNTTEILLGKWDPNKGFNPLTTINFRDGWTNNSTTFTQIALKVGLFRYGIDQGGNITGESWCGSDTSSGPFVVQSSVKGMIGYGEPFGSADLNSTASLLSWDSTGLTANFTGSTSCLRLRYASVSDSGSTTLPVGVPDGTTLVFGGDAAPTSQWVNAAPTVAIAYQNSSGVYTVTPLGGHLAVNHTTVMFIKISDTLWRTIGWR